MNLLLKIKKHFFPFKVIFNSLKLVVLLKFNKKYKINYVNKTVIIECIRDDIFYYLFVFLMCYFIASNVKKIILIKDDGVLKHFDVKKSLNGKSIDFLLLHNRKYILRTIQNFLFAFIKPKNLIIKKYSDLLKDIKIDKRKIDYKKLSVHTDASHKRFFGGRDVDINNEKHVKYIDLCYENEIINSTIANIIIDKYKPDLYITLDGIYTTYGPIVEKMKTNNITVLIYQVNGFQDRSLFIGDDHFSVFNVSRHWENFKNNIYSEIYEKKVSGFFNNRINNNLYTTSEEILYINEIKKRINNYKRIIGIFPNLTWDGAIKQRDTIFKSLLDWLIETINWIKNKPYCLLLREHPKPKEKYTDYDSILLLLKENITEIDNIKNLILIDGFKTIKSYFLIKEILDCSIVYNGTLGVEISYMGKPVIFAGNSPYRGKGVGYEPKSKKEYFKLLEEVNKNSTDFLENKNNFKKNAVTAAAYQFFYNSYYCPIMPTVYNFYNSKDKYWQSWDLDRKHLDPNLCPEWKRTLDRFLEPLLEK